ncbi:hypothetical protein D3C79_975240 [compost metagenome]
MSIVRAIDNQVGSSKAMALLEGEALLVRPDGVVAVQAMLNEPHVFVRYLSRLLPALALNSSAEEPLQA